VFSDITAGRGQALDELLFQGIAEQVPRQLNGAPSVLNDLDRFDAR
jgi:hypothetical protein